MSAFLIEYLSNQYKKLSVSFLYQIIIHHFIIQRITKLLRRPGPSLPLLVKSFDFLVLLHRNHSFTYVDHVPVINIVKVVFVRLIYFD